MKPLRIRIRNMAGYSAGCGKEKSPGRWWPGLKIAEYPAPEARGAQEYFQRRAPSKRRLVAKLGHRAGCVSFSRKRPSAVSVFCREYLETLSVP
jgi:hypothetical protein